MQVKIEPSWAAVLQGEFEKSYFQKLVEFLHSEKASGKTIYPRGGDIFKAFSLTPFDKVKVVILGQDPYHNPGQAMGLSFSVPNGIQAPPSLKNIFKEIEDELGLGMSGSTDLSPWAEQGVLLLNSILTVEAYKAASHSRIGWEEFTDAVISSLNERREGIIFLLWGNFARSKSSLIDSSRHFVLEAAHPSPLARGAFFGCGHFARTNEILLSQGKEPIDWRI